MTKLVLALVAIFAAATFATQVPASAQPAAKAPAVVVAPRSAADGCSTSQGGSAVASSTIAHCTGGYLGVIGYFRAHQKCHFGFTTQDQYGSWTVIGPGRYSQTAICGGLWSDGASYQTKPA